MKSKDNYIWWKIKFYYTETLNDVTQLSNKAYILPKQNLWSDPLCPKTFVDAPFVVPEKILIHGNLFF